MTAAVYSLHIYIHRYTYTRGMIAPCEFTKNSTEWVDRKIRWKYIFHHYIQIVYSFFHIHFATSRDCGGNGGG